MFDVVWSGRRHVMMGASRLDRYGRTAFIRVVGAAEGGCSVRGAPGNTIQNTTSYWIPNHSVKVFVEKVDVVSGVGYDRGAAVSEWVREHQELRHVVTNLVVEVEPPERAHARSYFTVFQARPDFPLQAIICGRYHDAFERAGTAWRFADRLILPDLIGDLSRHLRVAPGG
jgi:hypothetical protein